MQNYLTDTTIPEGYERSRFRGETEPPADRFKREDGSFDIAAAALSGAPDDLPEGSRELARRFAQWIEDTYGRVYSPVHADAFVNAVIYVAGMGWGVDSVVAQSPQDIHDEQQSHTASLAQLLGAA